MIEWLSIEKDGLPKDRTIGYLVCDALGDIEFSFISDYREWIGGSVYAKYDMSDTYFDFKPTHYSPINNINKPILVVESK